MLNFLEEVDGKCCEDVVGEVVRRLVINGSD
jgi:hypothetical protein